MNNFDEIKRVSKIYDDRALKFDSINAAGQWFSKDLTKQIIEEIIQKIDLQKSDVVLEVGCGSGVLGNVLAKKCHSFIGFDASRLMLKKFHDEHKDINLIQTSATHIPLRNNSFDKIIMNGVSMYFPNEEFLLNVLREIRRVSKSNSLIFIGENIVPSRYFWELVWFENLSSLGKFLAKPYIKFRRWLASKNSHFGGKWKYAHKDISPKIVQKFFENVAAVSISDAASYSIRKKLFGKDAKGNRRMDFLIKIEEDKHV